MKAGGLIERAFDIQTASYFTKLVMSALVLNMALALVEFPGAAASAPRGCTLAFAAYILAELLFLAVIAFDCALKAYYMNFKDYFKKNWQRSHATVIALLFADWALTLCSGGHAQHLAFLRALRPVLIITRSREVRRVYTVVKDMLPSLRDSAITLFYLLVAYSVVGVILLHASGDPNFATLPRAFLALFVLSTTDNYPGNHLECKRGQYVSCAYVCTLLFTFFFFF